MNKKFLTFGIFALILGFLFVPHVAYAADSSWWKDALASFLQVSGSITFGPLFAATGYVIMVVSSLILIICGFILDTVIQYTIIDTASNIGNSSGIGGSINIAWATLRDLANMAFIFILLYAAFKAMFDSDFGNLGTTIKNIIIVALLINFSLFFTKVVVDASNVVSVGFYNAIAQNNKDIGSNYIGAGTARFNGISGGYMRMLGLQTWLTPNVLQNGVDAVKIFTTAFVGSTFLIISSTIFLITGIMFVARFIILVFLMILSPLAAISFAVPGMNGQFKKWSKALIDQSFFAPLFFALTWVTFKLGNSLVTPTASWTDLAQNPFQNQQSVMALLINYILVTGFSIAALVFAKQMAKSTPFFSNITSGVGTAALGSIAWVGRHTIGRKSSDILNDTDLKERAARGDIGARMKLATAYKLAGSSFDVRGIADTKYGKQFGASEVLGIAGKAGGKGGFTKMMKDKAEREAKYAKEVYGQTDTEKEEIEKEKEAEKQGVLREREEKLAKANEELAEAEKKRKDYLNERTEEEQKAYEATKAEKRKIESALKAETDETEKEKLKEKLQNVTVRMANDRAVLDEKKKEIEENDNRYAELRTIATEKKTAKDQAKSKKDQKNIDDDEYSKELQAKIKFGGERMKTYAKRLEEGPKIGWGKGAIFSVPGAIIGGFYGKQIGKTIGSMQENRAAARAIRKAAGEKSNKEKAADLLKAMKDEEDKAAGTTIPGSASTAPSQPPSPSTPTS